jgi:hypothetical protein
VQQPRRRWRQASAITCGRNKTGIGRGVAHKSILAGSTMVPGRRVAGHTACMAAHTGARLVFP